MGILNNSDAEKAAQPFNVLNFEKEAERLVAQAKQDAERILNDARTQAEKLRKQTLVQAEKEGRKQGIDKGMEEGKSAGHKQGIAEIQEKEEPLHTLLTEMVSGIEENYQMALREARQDILGLAVAIAEKLVKHSVDVNEGESVRRNLMEAIGKTVKRDRLTLEVHPDDRKLIEEILPDIQKTFEEVEHLAVIENKDMDRGGCRVHTRYGSVDNTLTRQIAIVAAEIAGIDNYDG